MSYQLEKEVRETPLSDFAKFCNNLKGYRLFKNQKPLDKWEAFPGYDNSDEIILGYTGIKAHFKKERK